MPESIRDGRGAESIHTIHLNPSHHCFQSRRCRAKQSKQQSCFTMHFHGYNLELCSHLVVPLAGFLRLLTSLFCTIIWTSQEHFYKPKQNKTRCFKLERQRLPGGWGEYIQILWNHGVMNLATDKPWQTVLWYSY